MAIFELGLVAAEKAKSESAARNTIMIRNGKNVYTNLSPIGYLLKRSVPEGKDWLNLVSGVLKEAGVEPRVTLTLDGQPAQLTEPIFWQNGDRTTLCIVKNIHRRASISAFGEIGSKLADTKVKLKI